MKKTLGSLPVLLKQAQDKLDLCTKQLSACNGEVRKVREQYGAIDTYRVDYVQQLNDKLQNGVDASACRNHQNFISRLDDVLVEQQTALNEAVKQQKQARLEWEEAFKRLNALTLLEQRKRDSFQQAQNRKEQQLTDEVGARLYHTRRRMAF